MSKLFEMLYKSRGEIADLVGPLVEQETVPAPRAPKAPEREAAPPATTAPTPAEPAPGAAPPLGQIRTLRLQIPAPSPLLPFENSQRLASEQYRLLRTKIVQHPKQPRVIVVTSPASGDGKSVTAINTAGALALKSAGEVLLVDADLRRSAIHTQLGLPAAPGLTDLLTGACSLEDALVHTLEFPNLYVLAAGAPCENPVELLDSKAWQALCARLRDLFRYVIIDSPPMGGLADYDLLQAVADGVMLVMRPDQTDRSLSLSALEGIPKAKLLGVVMNCVPDWSPGRHTGADYYYYSGKKVYEQDQKDGSAG